jgi:hypothetical protein
MDKYEEFLIEAFPEAKITFHHTSTAFRGTITYSENDEWHFAVKLREGKDTPEELAAGLRERIEQERMKT